MQPFVFYQDEQILVLYKPRGLPTAPLKNSHKATLVDWATENHPIIKEVKGFKKDEYSLLHRLDNDTEGLVLFTKDQVSYNFLYQQQQDNRIQKGYLAYCKKGEATLWPNNFTPESWVSFIEQKVFKIDFTLETRFVKAEARSSKVRAVSVLSTSKKATKPYTTSFKIEKDGNMIKAECFLTQGFRHQVRATLCALGLPIVGDSVYTGVRSQESGIRREEFMFWANSLQFIHPKTHQLLTLNYLKKDLQ